MSEIAFAGFQEQGYRVSWAITGSESAQVHALRAEVFCRELGWVGSADDTVERDEFDAGSVHVAVVDERSNVVAAVRLTGGDSPWMLDSVFRRLAGPGLVEKGPHTAEASRLVVARSSRAERLLDGRRTCDLVYKGTYAYCVLKRIRHVYMVTSDVVLRHMLRTGLPCVALAPPTRMPDGVNALAVKLDWSQLSRSAALAYWYESGWRESLWCPDEAPRAPDGDVSHVRALRLATRMPPRTNAADALVLRRAG